MQPICHWSALTVWVNAVYLRHSRPLSFLYSVTKRHSLPAAISPSLCYSHNPLLLHDRVLTAAILLLWCKATPSIRPGVTNSIVHMGYLWNHWEQSHGRVQYSDKWRLVKLLMTSSTSIVSTSIQCMTAILFYLTRGLSFCRFPSQLLYGKPLRVIETIAAGNYKKFRMYLL